MKPTYSHRRILSANVALVLLIGVVALPGQAANPTAQKSKPPSPSSSTGTSTTMGTSTATSGSSSSSKSSSNSGSTSPSKQDWLWRIDYLPGQVTSNSTVYLSANAIRIETGAFEITSASPTWSAVVVGKSKKMVYDMPRAKWMRDGFFVDRPDPKEYMNPRKAASTEQINFRGLAATRRRWDTIESDHFYRHRSKPQKCTIELVTTDGAIPISNMQLELLSAWYGIPSLTGVPLFWQNVMPTEKSLRLRVAKVSRVPAKSVSFKPMSGCTKVTSMMKLVDSRFSNALNDFMEFEGLQQP